MPGPIILIGSRTGGPLIPLLALKDELLDCNPDLNFIIVGVRGGFEEQAAKSENLELLYLPEVKGIPGIRRYGSSLPGRLLSILLYPFFVCTTALRLSYSSFLAWRIIATRKPSYVLSMSNFLSVPVIWAAAWHQFMHRILYQFKYKFLHRFSNQCAHDTRKNSPIILLHQMDIRNLTVKLTGRFAHIRSGGFHEILAANPGKNIIFAPNPIRRKKFDAINARQSTALLKKENLLPDGIGPLLLVFGGGSGSAFINRWLHDNIEDLGRFFRVLHLRGFLQEQNLDFPDLPSYRGTEGLTDLMPAALHAADIVISRAGMSAISELIFLRKNAYIVPIPGGHQEQNAELARSYFRILRQADVLHWEKQIVQDFQNGFPEYDKVHWDYYQPEHEFILRDLILGF